MSRPDAGWAFPTDCEQGMTLRDYFAAKAMQADMSDGGIPMKGADQAFLAKCAYAMADAMLAERVK